MRGEARHSPPATRRWRGKKQVSAVVDLRMYIEGGRIIFSFLSHVPLSSGCVEHSRKAVWFQMRFLAHFVYSEPSVLSLLARPTLGA